jgi:hypothetical protein
VSVVLWHKILNFRELFRGIREKCSKIFLDIDHKSHATIPQRKISKILQKLTRNYDTFSYCYSFGLKSSKWGYIFLLSYLTKVFLVVRLSLQNEDELSIGDGIYNSGLQNPRVKHPCMLSCRDELISYKRLRDEFFKGYKILACNISTLEYLCGRVMDSRSTNSTWNFVGKSGTSRAKFLHENSKFPLTWLVILSAGRYCN